jgi:hypothetical protein
MLRQFTILGASLLFAACGSYGHDVPLRAADSYNAHAKAGALTAGADVFDNALKCNHAFGENLSRTFTPVQVVLENGADDKYLVDRNRATLECDDGTTLTPVSSSMVYKEFHTNLLAVGFFVGRNAEAEAANGNDAKRIDWAEKELPAQVILAPGQRTGGFLYFHGKCAARTRTLRLAAESLKSDDRVPIEIALH